MVSKSNRIPTFCPNQISSFLKVFDTKFQVFRQNYRYFSNDCPCQCTCFERCGQNKKLIDVASSKIGHLYANATGQLRWCTDLSSLQFNLIKLTLKERLFAQFLAVFSPQFPGIFQTGKSSFCNFRFRSFTVVWGP